MSLNYEIFQINKLCVSSTTRAAFKCQQMLSVIRYVVDAATPLEKKPQIYQVKEISINEHNFDAFFVFSKDEIVSSYH